MALRSNFTAAKLGLNLTNALQQMSGVAQSFVVAGKKDMAVGIAKTVRDPAAAAGAAPFMATRQTTFNKDMDAFLESSASGATPSRWKEFKKDYWGPAAFWLMQKVQWHFADVPTWIAGYEQDLRKFGGNESRAAAHANGLVKRAQVSGLFTDRSAIERGSLGTMTRQNEFVKLFSTLGSYMFAKTNVAYERGKKAQQVFAENGASKVSGLEAASLVADWCCCSASRLWLVLLPGPLPAQSSAVVMLATMTRILRYGSPRRPRSRSSARCRSCGTWRRWSRGTALAALTVRSPGIWQSRFGLSARLLARSIASSAAALRRRFRTRFELRPASRPC
ncbi:hypothetical protein XI03_07670 [Bradyrhizobium sp. CCBAU 65884]|uniref:hypothetical protein n=1 Tax=Bradyrhizobium sp. CCBAU 65884 TaxID=722477 RepID=UPI0023050D16|nr:hypothetical protein [Bradyrhizobium sp. CCBAU 65884]MDA9474385.1 hypothetical protein [Bradyrhizobium sp. CCBAU 65884]